MRTLLALIAILLLAGPAAALGRAPAKPAAPVTTNAMMKVPKILMRLPNGELSVSGARILSDTEIAALIPSSASIPGSPNSPSIMTVAKLAVGATEQVGLSSS
jgi:hypothetical protein